MVMLQSCISVQCVSGIFLVQCWLNLNNVRDHSGHFQLRLFVLAIGHTTSGDQWEQLSLGGCVCDNRKPSFVPPGTHLPILEGWKAELD